MRFILFLFVLLTSFNLYSQIELNSLFTDNMVLQRNEMVNIWGKSNSNEIVKIKTSWNDITYKVRSDDKGNWNTKVQTNFKRGSQTLTISTKSETKTIRNILLGEVWFGSGQSNMQMSFEGYRNEPVRGSLEILEHSNNKEIRLITVPRVASKLPSNNFEGKWEVSNPEGVRKFSAVAYSFALLINKTLDVPVGIIHNSWGGTPAEAWTEKSFLENNFEEGVIKNNRDDKRLSHEPSYLFNGMINPLIPFTIKGALWYQGESNVYRANFYSKLMKIMVDSWRSKWNQGSFPFYYVQIAPFRYNGPDNDSSAYLRESQLEAMNIIQNSGMVVTSDIGDLNSIHPPEKIEIGNRLAYWALNKTYNIKNVVPSGPIVESYNIDENKVEINFKYASSGFYQFNGPLKDFEIAGNDGVFYKANAKISGLKIIVESADVKEPKMLRYGWKNYFESTLFNIDKLPASSFFIRDLSK